MDTSEGENGFQGPRSIHDFKVGSQEGGTMKTEMGEYLVGAYLRIIKGCDFIDYNVRRPGGGMSGLDELDVIGLDFKDRTAYLCEVTTHLDGLLIGKIMKPQKIR